VRVALACSLAVLAVLLVGCGGKKAPSSNGEAGKSPKQIVADVKAAVAGASSVHVVGAGTSDGTKLALDLHFKTGAGGGGSGHVSINGLGFEIIRVDGKSYFKGDANFLSHFAGKQAAQLMAGKWFYVANSVSGFASLSSLTNLISLTNAILGTTGPFSKGATATIDGQPAIAIVDSGKGGSLYVATTGPAYPVEITPGSSDSGTIKFEDWDAPVTLTPPKNPVDYAKLVGKK
jgi:hypothetical protein